jgi:hypothetical protein
MEEVSMEATVKYMLKPFTSAKSTDAVAGDDGPVMRSSTKTKVVAGSSHEEGLHQPVGWIDDFVGADTASFDPAVFDEMPHKVKLSAEAPGRKHRLSKAEIRTILALKPGPLEIPTADYLDDLTDTFSPGWIEQRKRQIDDAAEARRRMDEESEVFRQQVIKSVLEKGYFEVDDEFLINRDKANQRELEQWAKQDFGGLRFATDEEEAEMEGEWYPPYEPDEHDAAILALLKEDEDDDLIDDDGDAQGVDEAHVLN